jgi:hypothetical protein
MGYAADIPSRITMMEAEWDWEKDEDGPWRYLYGRSKGRWRKVGASKVLA